MKRIAEKKKFFVTENCLQEGIQDLEGDVFVDHNGRHIVSTRHAIYYVGFNAFESLEDARARARQMAEMDLRDLRLKMERIQERLKEWSE